MAESVFELLLEFLPSDAGRLQRHRAAATFSWHKWTSVMC